MTEALYIGLMSGTSLDGVDAVLAGFSDGDGRTLRVLSHLHRPFTNSLRQELLALNQSGTSELHRAALAANAVAEVYADTVCALHQAWDGGSSPVCALGAHGQTVRHRPGEFDGTGYTVQLLNGALLAERTGIDTICDFRSRDVAAGGQGAPLVPAFHAAVFHQPGVDQAVLNLGGIGNLTLLHADGQVGGFDCGPGNALLDHWCERHLGLPYDDGGRWSRQGRVDPALLTQMLAEPFFHRPPPKSTGRDLFHADWLQAALARIPATAPRTAQDVQATLVELTAQSAISALRQNLPQARRLLVCGGGAYNQHLMQRLGDLIAPTSVMSTAAAGLEPLLVEAAAFAWMASAFTHRRAASAAAVTGARGPRILGALYPAA